MKYRVHRFDMTMTANQSKLEQFLNSLEGEIVAIVPNVTVKFMWAHQVDFLLIVEKFGLIGFPNKATGRRLFCETTSACACSMGGGGKPSS